MKNSCVILVFFGALLITGISFSQKLPEWKWVDQIGSKLTNESVNCIQTDTKGNIIALAHCLDSTEVVSGRNSMKIVKYAANGSVIWKIPVSEKSNIYSTVSATANISPLSLSVDSNDNIFALLYLNDTALIGETLLDQEGVCLVKFSADGRFLWHSSLGFYFSDSFSQIANDTLGNVYTCIHTTVINTVTVNGKIILTADTSRHHVFLIKLDPSGNVLWAKSEMNSSDYILSPGGMAVGRHSISLAGCFSENADIAGTPLDASSYTDFFLARFDPEGEPIWVKQVSDVDRVGGVQIDADENVYTLADITDLSDNERKFLLSKYDSGGTLHWQQPVHNVWGSQGFALSPGDQRLLLTGVSIFDAEGHNDNNAQWFVPQIVACYTMDGDSLWTELTSNRDTGVAYWGLCADRGAHYYTSGYFGTNRNPQIYSDTLPTPGVIGGMNVISKGGQDGFIAAFSNASASVERILSSNDEFSIYPNPANTAIKLIAKDPDMQVSSVRFMNVLGEEIQRIKIDTQDQSISVLPLKSGVYYLLIETTKEKYTRPLIISR